MIVELVNKKMVSNSEQIPCPSFLPVSKHPTSSRQLLRPSSFLFSTIHQGNPPDTISVAIISNPSEDTKVPIYCYKFRRHGYLLHHKNNHTMASLSFTACSTLPRLCPHIHFLFWSPNDALETCHRYKIGANLPGRIDRCGTQLTAYSATVVNKEMWSESKNNLLRLHGIIYLNSFDNI